MEALLLIVIFVALPLLQRFLNQRQEKAPAPAGKPAPRTPRPRPPRETLGTALPPPEAPAVRPAPTRALVMSSEPEWMVRRGGRARARGLRGSDARRAMALMAIFGPCRALKPYAADPET